MLNDCLNTVKGKPFISDSGLIHPLFQVSIAICPFFVISSTLKITIFKLRIPRVTQSRVFLFRVFIAFTSLNVAGLSLLMLGPVVEKISTRTVLKLISLAGASNLLLLHGKKVSV